MSGLSSNPPGKAAWLLTPEIFPHAAPQLADLRLYRDGAETPYVIRTAMPTEGAERTITPLNLGARGGQTVFDASMPDGQYSDLQLAVTGAEFYCHGDGDRQPDGDRKRGNKDRVLHDFRFDRPASWAAARCFICRNRISDTCISASRDQFRRRDHGNLGGAAAGEPAEVRDRCEVHQRDAAGRQFCG